MTQHGADRDVVASDSPDELASMHLGAYDVDEPPPPLARAVRRRLPIVTAVLTVLAIGAGGFFAGVRVEKSKLPAASSASGLTAADLAARFAGAGAGAGAGAAATAATPSASASGAPSAGAGAGAAAPDASGRANIVGTVTVVQGNTLYVTDASGNTVKVTTNSGTTITKTATGTMQDLAPGQSVVIRGVQSSVGVYAAQSVSEGAAGFAGGFGGGGRGTRPGGTGTGTGTGAGPGAGTGATAAPSPSAGG
jgi:hypothetical protein